MIFPFTAFVNQEDLKTALIINAINPQIGGVLIKGEKGSGKSTVVRSLVGVLPDIEVVSDCPFNCRPVKSSSSESALLCESCFSALQSGDELPIENKAMQVVTLPLGITEDNLLGSIDLEQILREGIKALTPGLLARANQNILYIDEINLLPDHIADDILDCSVTGWNVLEREGISIRHPARFILIGTMNIEEGELRPQILDRFALSVNVEKILKPEARVEVIKRNLAYEDNPTRFAQRYSNSQEKLRSQILTARNHLPHVQLENHLLWSIAQVCIDLKVDGVRPDMVIAKTSMTLAAFENAQRENTHQNTIKVEEKHLMKAALLALGHRTREGGFQPPATSEEIQQTFGEAFDKSKDIGDDDISVKEKEDDSESYPSVGMHYSESAGDKLSEKKN